MSILVINTGSSSLKFGLFDSAAREALVEGVIDWAARTGQADFLLRQPNAPARKSQLAVADHRSAVAQVVKAMNDPHILPGSLVPKLEFGNEGAISAVGHRVVHGGERFRDSVRLDSEAKAGIAQLSELAPLHNPPALEAIEAVEYALPGVPQVAVFDTAFFAHLPQRAFLYPLPYSWYTDWSIRRYGFHGISHAYCAGRAGEVVRWWGDDHLSTTSPPHPPTTSPPHHSPLTTHHSPLRLITCHLGNGCSATAVRDGVAVATTMGLTPLEGMMMGTRCGSVDPGILLHVQRQHGLTVDQLDDALNHRSGLLGVSGVSSDFRQVEAAASQGNDRARLALEMYADRVRATIGALAVTLGGIDALIFTAGVGTNSANLRAAVCNGLECLGLQLDSTRNTTCQPDADVATDHSSARILVLQTQEELLIAREVRRLTRKDET